MRFEPAIVLGVVVGVLASSAADAQTWDYFAAPPASVADDDVT